MSYVHEIVFVVHPSATFDAHSRPSTITLVAFFFFFFFFISFLSLFESNLYPLSANYPGTTAEHPLEGLPELW